MSTRQPMQAPVTLTQATCKEIRFAFLFISDWTTPTELVIITQSLRNGKVVRGERK